MNVSSRSPSSDYIAMLVCTLAWGTTWYAITLQLGVVDAVVSVAYRFALASALLFAWCLWRREPMGLTRRQHLAALGVGVFNIAINYPFAYWAEERVASGVVAVFYAALAFLNLVTFRIAFGQRAPQAAWVASGLGIAGVAILSWSEVTAARMDTRAIAGLALAFGGVACAAMANVYAKRGEDAGAPLATMMAWAMAYGSALLVIFSLATGRTWSFEVTPRYVLSLLYLACIGSVVAFLLYYGLARRRGYTTASYIFAVTPLIAMAMSSLFERKTWGRAAVAGAALVLLGQWLLLRARKKTVPVRLARMQRLEAGSSKRKSA